MRPALASWLVRYFVAVVAGLAVLVYTTAQLRPGAVSPIRSATYGYYLYLPSVVLYGDLSLESVARDCCGGAYPDATAIVRSPLTGRWVNPHPIGVAIQTLPFFVAAHGLTRWSNLPPDGFSPYYQHAAALAGITALVVGLACVRRLLSRRFNDVVTGAALIALTFGTRLFRQGVSESTSSHTFIFFLVALLLVAIDRWWASPSSGRAVAIGAVAGLLAITRLPYFAFLAILPFYGLATVSPVRGALATLWRRRVDAIVIAFVALAVIAPQLAWYRRASGLSLIDVSERVVQIDTAPLTAAVLVFGLRLLTRWPLVARLLGPPELSAQ